MTPSQDQVEEVAPEFKEEPQEGALPDTDKPSSPQKEKAQDKEDTFDQPRIQGHAIPNRDLPKFKWKKQQKEDNSRLPNLRHILFVVVDFVDEDEFLTLIRE